MNISENTKYILAAVGILLLGGAFYLYAYGENIRTYFMPQDVQEAVHVHADFSFYILDERVNLTDPQFQSTAENAKHPRIHFHDGVDTMIHRHAEGITLGEFFDSLGMTLSDSCVTLADDRMYCSDNSNQLTLFVNGEAVTEPAQYIVQEEDRLLLYYGDPQSPNLERYKEEITDEACIYSGTCPERGEPPFESCGITCEVTG